MLNNLDISKAPRGIFRAGIFTRELDWGKLSNSLSKPGLLIQEDYFTPEEKQESIQSCWSHGHDQAVWMALIDGP